MTYTPNDPAFNRAVSAQLEGSEPDERVIFMDRENKVREVVYASMFDAGELQRVRAVLEQTEELKAVVHVSAAVLGSRSGSGTRFSTVEYLPDSTFYVRQHAVRPALWVTQKDIIQSAVEATQSLYEREEEGPEEGK